MLRFSSLFLFGLPDLCEGVHNDLIKRILRDINRTGQNPQEAIQQITETVYPMYKVRLFKVLLSCLLLVQVIYVLQIILTLFVSVKAFIEPDLRRAHIRIVNKFNPFSALLRPSYLLKSRKQVDEAKVLELMPGCTVTKESSYGSRRLQL